MTRKTITLIAALIFLSTPAFADGAISGDTGGHEKDATVHDREEGMIRHTITGPSGEYTFDELEPKEYMAGSTGRICPRVRVRDGETARILWTGQPGYDPEDEVWTTNHYEFGQTFVATGPCITGVGLWNPCPEVRLEVAFHEDGPDGREIYSYQWGSPKGWVFGRDFEYGEIPVEPGRTYYVRFTSLDNKRWCIGMPRLGDVYPDGIAYFDGVPHPESDLGASVIMPNDGLVRVARVTGGPGYVEEGTPAGHYTSAGQTFTATTGNIIKLYVNAGFGGAPIPGDFLFQIYEDGPGGKPVSPEMKVRILSNWGGEAIFFPDQVLLDKGKTYYFKYWREDGDAFYPYMAQNKYEGGEAFREDQPVGDGWDLTFNIEGEITPDSITYPYNIAATEVGTDRAVIEWETGNPSTAQVRYGYYGGETMETPLVRDKALEHRVVLTDLEPSTPYWYRVVSGTEKPGAVFMQSKTLDFMTAMEGEDVPRYNNPPSMVLGHRSGADEPWKVPDNDPSLAPVENPSFEEPKTGEWQSVAGYGSRTQGRGGFVPHTGDWMWGWSMVYSGEEDWKPAFRINKHEVLSQRVAVEKGATYEFSAWVCTGDRGSGWGRDSRVSLVYDPSGGDTLDATNTINPDWATQQFATKSQWKRFATTFQAEADEVVVGFHFWQWWALEGSYLYVDDVRLRRVE